MKTITIDEEKVMHALTQAQSHALPNTVPENLFSIHFIVLDKVSSKAETTSVDEENNGGGKGKRYSIDLSIAKIVPVKEKKRNSSKLLFIFLVTHRNPDQ